MASVRDSQRPELHQPSNNSSNRISTPLKSSPPKQQARPTPTAPRSQQPQRRPTPQREEQHEAVVSPELLVDALSGHEDGLLGIAERLMEHYDAGYDVMGEAIIDAFADVQKLFQHVVEAAHMEGAAFESSRREAELQELRRQLSHYTTGGAAPLDLPTSPGGVSRHEEIIDQDVKDVLTEAVRLGAPLRDANKHMECYQLFEQACQNASSLLPVDSDHRGRLQLSIARAESMSPDRACAILRYAMDDVMRSGLRTTNAPPPDVTKRSDMVLSKPKDIPSINGAAGQVVQSSAEALASLVEEMKEVLGAPVYDNTPLQSVAQRFWVALGEAQRSQQKNEELLEQQLGKLKGEYLMARAEWEERLTASQEVADQFKRKYLKEKQNVNNGEVYMEQARVLSSKWSNERRDADEDMTMNMTFDSAGSKNRTAGSVVSIGSGLAQSARQIVGSFNCAGLNERSGPLVESEVDDPVMVRQSFSSSSRESRLPPQPSLSKQQSSRRGRSNTRRDYQNGPPNY